MLRLLALQFEHRLFLSATPHNGHTRCFTGLLAVNPVDLAVSAATAEAFLDTQDAPYRTAPSTNELKPADVAAKARGFTMPVECWK